MFVDYTHCPGLWCPYSLLGFRELLDVAIVHSTRWLEFSMDKVSLCWLCPHSPHARSSPQAWLQAQNSVHLSLPHRRHKLYLGNETSPSTLQLSCVGCMVEVRCVCVWGGGASSEALQEKARREPGAQSQNRGHPRFTSPTPGSGGGCSPGWSLSSSQEVR